MLRSIAEPPTKKPRAFLSKGADLPNSAPTRKILQSAQGGDMGIENWANSNQRSEKVIGRDFNGRDFPIPRPEERYNDDVALPPLRRSAQILPRYPTKGYPR